jgi:HAD superfamily hydrolase (TIGR01484 family)
VGEQTIAALEEVRASGRRLLLVSGRELDDLRRVFGRLDLFDRVVTENGAVLYRPDVREEQLLAEPPDDRLVAYLRERGVQPLSVGRSIVATWEPHDAVVLEAIRSLGLELQIVFNKGAVMVLPPGISKASGLMAALRELRLSPHNVVGVGDAENDHAFLALCELSAAVGNALTSVKERADIVLQEPRGAGVAQLVEMLLSDGLQSVEERLPRLSVPLGESDGQPVGPTGQRSLVLLAGASGAGKSTLTMAFLEAITERGYQVCLVDPEGDYEHLEQLVVLGTAERPPALEEVLAVLQDPDRSVAVNLLGLGMDERPPFNAALLARLHELRTQLGRPHWVVLDEAHHLLPTHWRPDDPGSHAPLDGMLLITVHPDRLSRVILERVDLLAALGRDAPAAVVQVAEATGRPLPRAMAPPGDGAGLLWHVDRSGLHGGVTGDRPAQGSSTTGDPLPFIPASPHGVRRRHRRKYAVGALGPDKSFWFRGEDDRLNLRAQNLALFVQIAAGVDDDTWSFHLRRGDYSSWVRDSIKDDDLADEVEAVELDATLDDSESRARVRDAIESRYTASA